MMPGFLQQHDFIEVTQNGKDKTQDAHIVGVRADVGRDAVSPMAAYGIDYFIIYGHDTLDGTMFGSPDYYRQQDFWQTHSELNIYTGGERRTYQVFAVVKTRILNADEDGFRYYNAVGDLSDGDVRTLVDWLKENAEYDTGITPGADEQLLTLSTCGNHVAQGRFVVAARLVACEKS